MIMTFTWNIEKHISRQIGGRIKIIFKFNNKSYFQGDLTNWWAGSVGAMVDFTDDKCCQWFTDYLGQMLQN